MDVRIGNTPTCVGKTARRMRHAARRRKHPHMRGEDLLFLFPTRFPIRNTPTCVGKTAVRAYFNAYRRKHPHMRGEDGFEPPRMVSLRETPPHAWGRPAKQLPGMPTGGNTPTCVGKTNAGHGRASRTKKHPHMRGEDGCVVVLYGLNTETPPHAWGRHERTARHQSGNRNTPTCVGKTPLSGLWTG